MVAWGSCGFFVSLVLDRSRVRLADKAYNRDRRAQLNTLFLKICRRGSSHRQLGRFSLAIVFEGLAFGPQVLSDVVGSRVERGGFVWRDFSRRVV